MHFRLFQFLFLPIIFNVESIDEEASSSIIQLERTDYDKCYSFSQCFVTSKLPCEEKTCEEKS
ncbi:hypothetical protein GLYMA_06G219901v4 [Glycine max]|nr:hypothetical protein GLYMA_06G219901v4 [Glycine max]KAH1127052.1 hypothetical protein GYH30_015873 [Glycine max]